MIGKTIVAAALVGERNAESLNLSIYPPPCLPYLVHDTLEYPLFLGRWNRCDVSLLVDADRVGETRRYGLCEVLVVQDRQDVTADILGLCPSCFFHAYSRHSRQACRSSSNATEISGSTTTTLRKTAPSLLEQVSGSTPGMRVAFCVAVAQLEGTLVDANVSQASPF